MGSQPYFVPASRLPELGLGQRGWLPDVAATGEGPFPRLASYRGSGVSGAIHRMDEAQARHWEARLPEGWRFETRIALDANGDEVRVKAAWPPGTPPDAPAAESSRLPLFVYGTLMRDESNHGVLTSCGITAVERARMRGLLIDLGPYPALVRPLNVRGHVHGDLIWIADMDAALGATDPIEDFQGFGDARSTYRRTILNAHLDDSRTQAAWTYLYNRAMMGRPLVPGGDWRLRPRAMGAG